MLELLSDLGLTVSEAKAYLALAEIGPSSAEKIAEVTKVARERVYVMMPLLREKGLVEEIISSPKKFSAVPVRQGLKLLIEQEKEKTKNHAAKAREIIEKQVRTPRKIEEKFKIALLPKGKTIPLTVKKAAEEAKHSVDLIVSEENLMYGFQVYLDDGWLNRIAEKGIECRIIVESPIKSTALANALKNVGLRFSPEIGLGILIVDKKRIYLRLSNETRWEETQMLFIDDPSVSKIFSNYFQNMWLNARGQVK